ncbi:MAG TPA: dihydroorotase family protein [Gaiellaceae bacterium]
MSFDLAFHGGSVVTSSGRRRASVYVRDERIAVVGGETLPAARTVDATGLLVLPGMIDTHVHFMDPGDASREDFPTGTSAAACAGVTTVVEHTHSRPVRTVAELQAKRAHLAQRAVVDYGLAAHAWPDLLDEAEPLWRAGATYLKVFTCTTHGVPGFDAAHLLELFRRSAAVGARCLVHCEDESITGYWEESLRAAGRRDPAIVCEWRNRDAEATATLVTAFLARIAGASVVIAHASNPDILRLVERERAAGADVLVESCPQYLLLREDELLDFGPFRKFTPPARARSQGDLDRMWEALATNRIHHVSSDHAPSTAAQKTAGEIWDVHFGLPGIDTTLPVLLDAARAGLIAYERVVEAYSEAPARAYGLWPRKGSLREGADADVVLVDPERSWAVTDDSVISRAGWSPFSGRTFVGGAVATYVRGALVAADGKAVAEPGTGRFVAGAGARPQAGTVRE